VLPFLAEARSERQVCDYEISDNEV
jgi:hypothetical protein